MATPNSPPTWFIVLLGVAVLNTGAGLVLMASKPEPAPVPPPTTMPQPVTQQPPAPSVAPVATPRALLGEPKPFCDFLRAIPGGEAASEWHRVPPNSHRCELERELPGSTNPTFPNKVVAELVEVEEGRRTTRTAIFTAYIRHPVTDKAGNAVGEMFRNTLGEAVRQLDAQDLDVVQELIASGPPKGAFELKRAGKAALFVFKRELVPKSETSAMNTDIYSLEARIGWTD